MYQAKRPKEESKDNHSNECNTKDEQSYSEILKLSYPLDIKKPFEKGEEKFLKNKEEFLEEYKAMVEFMYDGNLNKESPEFHIICQIQSLSYNNTIHQ